MKSNLPLSITCDQSGPFMRAAVWRGKELHSLFIKNDYVVDLSGAQFIGKVARLMPAQKLAFIDCGLPEMVSIPSSNLRIGSYIKVEIKTSPRQGKAFEGRKIGETENKKCELILPPPVPWQKALQSLKVKSVSSIQFYDEKNRRLAETWIDENFPVLQKALKSVSKESLHPTLDEHIDGLLSKEVSLSKGAKLVIEPTEALISIDIDGGSFGSALEVNCLAASEIMRHLRLRNLSGLIVVDCLKMNQRTDGSKLVNAFLKASEDDFSTLNSINLTKLGLIEFTRERKGLPIYEIMGKGEA